MKSATISAFLSCSYSSEDKQINDLVVAVCEGLDIKPTNVSNGYTTLPPEEAKNQIRDVPFVIAIITKRLESVDGKNIMPSAVREEIAMAYGLNKPLLLITEKNINLDGFMKSYGTHLSFDKDEIHNNEFIKKLILSIHGAKMNIVSTHDLITSQGIEEFYAEYLQVLYELKEDKDGFYWEYSISKKMNFNEKYNRVIKTGAWITRPVKIPENEEKMHFEAEIVDGNKDFNLNLNILKHEASLVEAEIEFSPTPETGDYIEYSTLSRSKYLSPLYKEDLIDKTPIIINDKEYYVFDGVIPIQRTKIIKFQIRFPRKYGLNIKDIVFFAAGYSATIDYIVPSETERAKVKMETFAGNVDVYIEVESPLVGHFYGIAWNTPEKS